MRIHSHSSLGSFENCPRQFWYQYIGKPPVEKMETIEAFLGKRVHETLETRSGGLGPPPALSRAERKPRRRLAPGAVGFFDPRWRGVSE